MIYLNVKDLQYINNFPSALVQGISTFGTVGPVDKFFRQIGPANVGYFNQQMGDLHAVCYSKSSFFQITPISQTL